MGECSYETDMGWSGIAFGFMLIFAATVVPAQSGMMGGQMGQSGQTTESSRGGMISPGMMGMAAGGMQGMSERMGMPRPSQMVRMLKAELGLSDEQAKQLKEILSQATKAGIKQRAELHIAELQLSEMREADQVDMVQVEARLKAIEGLRTQLRLDQIKAHEQAKGTLTPDQRQKLALLHDRLTAMTASGMMSATEMMGEGGSSSTEMMGPRMMQQMMRGMMGGGMGGQPQSPMQMAGSAQNLTQEDTQGAVTVSATLLTPDKPRTDGKLAVQVKLDTHVVDPDQYQLEQLALLRNAQGREVQALGFESPSGSGHHREGVLLFPGTDASGKPILSPEAKSLTLILRGIGGVQERGFRW
jgi:Spy/CpxP family protein refolding chaperone